MARSQGLEDSGLGVKVALNDAGEASSLKPTLALIAGTSLPTGADAFRNRHALPEMKLLAAWVTDRPSRIRGQRELGARRGLGHGARRVVGLGGGLGGTHGSTG